MELPEFLRPAHPSVFTLEITTRCQNDCIGCGNVFNHTQREMPSAFWEDAIGVLSPFARGYRVTGGEPTLHKDFDKIVSLIDQTNVPWSLFTNGNWAKPEKVLNKLEKCKNLKGLLVSLHGSNDRDYQTFCQINAFARVVENIKLAISRGLRVTTNTLLLKTTIQHLEEVADLSLLLGTSGVVFGRYYGASHGELIPSIQELHASLLKIAELKSKDHRISISNCVPTCFLPETDFGGRGCTSGITHCTIGPMGEVRPCTHVDLVLGNILENDLLEIWAGQALETWRDAIPVECYSCFALNHCRGGCRATAKDLALSRDPLIVGPLHEEKRLPVIEIGLDDYPRICCQVVMAANAVNLIGDGRYITLTQSSIPILQDLNGHVSIQTLIERHGPAVGELVGRLVNINLAILE